MKCRIISPIILRFVVLSTFALSILVSPESKAAESQTKRVVRVGVSNNNPVGIHGNGGPPSGLVIDIIEDIAKHEGWQLKYVETIWPNLMKLLKNGGIDLLGGMAYTGKRAKQFDFSSEVVISNWGVLYKNKSTIIDGIVDVAGKKIALIPKGVHTVALKRTADSFGLKYQSLPAKGYGHTLEMVSSGEADVGVVSRTFHISHGHKYTALPTNVILNPVKLMFAAPLGKGGGLLDRIDVHLKRQKNDPKSVYSMSTQRWFSVSPREEIPRWLYWLIGSVIVAALVAWVQNIWLKSLVQKRTAELQSAYDNTEKSIQERTLQLRDEVEERRRTEVALVEARENADVANQAKSNFLSQMSHELRTPLNAILGFGQLLLMNPKEDVSNKQKEYIDDIIMSGGLLLDLINQVLDLSRIEAGKVDLKIEDVPIEELLNECVILITPTADEKSVTVNLDMDSGIVNSVRTDYVRLKEVILNLLSNAVKYNKPKGTVQISVNIQDRKFVRFSVADTGVGFRLDDHEKIFLPFNRLDTIKRKEEGTGIGLAITKNLVTLMNGKIGVESEVGVGSKFWVDIPAASR